MANFMNMGYPNKFKIRAVFSLFVLTLLISGQIVGGAWVWALDNATGMGAFTGQTAPLIAGLRGEVTLFQNINQGQGSVPHYRQTMGVGDVISTGEESVVEILFPSGMGLVTVQEFSEASLENNGSDQLVLNMKVGEGEISSPLKGQGENRPLLIQTPNLVVKTSGGLVTMEVKSTLARTVSPAPTHAPYIHRTSLHSQATPSSGTALSEKFCVKEGSLDIDFKNNPGQKALNVSTGQCVGFLNGSLSAETERTQLTDWRAICAVNPHCEIPEGLQKFIAKKQMGQALALERALVGSENSDSDIDEQVILATTGLTLAAASQIITPPGTGGGDPFNPCLTDPDSCQEPLPPAPGGNPVNEPPQVGGGGGGGNPNPGNIQSPGTLIPQQGVGGGPGLLLYTNSEFLAAKELFLVDNNANANTSPHKGKVPQSPLIISTLTPTPAFNNVTPTNEFIPPVFPSFAQGPTTDVQLGVEGGTRQQVLQQLAQWLRSTSIDPDNPMQGITAPNGAGENCATIMDCAELIWALGQNGTFQLPGFDAGIDGAIQARSVGTSITLTHGVSLVNTSVDISGLSTIGQPTKTSQFFSNLHPSLGNQLDGSLVSILGNPGTPAKVIVEDRLLGILDHSQVQPQNSNLSTSLIAILDSELKGPVAPPQNIGRADIPSLVEVVDSSVEVENGVVVASTASAGQNGVLDQALLEASSPLMAMIRGTFESSSDFGRVAGQNAKLVANLVSGDSLIRVDASSFTVNGNLFSVTGGGQFMVSGGSLLSVQGNSTVNLNNGVFVSVGAGSLFSLTGGGLVNFGTGQNVVNVSNNLCGGGGCFAPFSNPAWQVAGNPADFSAGAGSNPFLDLGNFADGSVNTLNIAPGSAILQVQPGGSIQIN